jgi:hypothetical protein
MRRLKPGTKRVSDKDRAWTMLNPHMEKDTFYTALSLSLPSLAKAYAFEVNEKRAAELGVDMSKLPRKEKLSAARARETVEGWLDACILREPPQAVLERTKEREKKQ